MPSKIEQILSKLRQKKILILGFGREGQSSYRFLAKHLPNANITIADAAQLAVNENFPPELNFFCGSNYLEAINEAEIILKSPGIPDRLIQLQDGQVLSSQTALFLDAYGQQTIGISGTKGKSTTSSLIFHLLSQSGNPCVITGNIGTPCFDSIEQIDDKTLVVFELSANQLQHIRRSPKVAVLLNIFEEHLDHFGSFEAYCQSKLNLIRYSKTGDYRIVHRSLQPLIPQSEATTLFFPNEALANTLSLNLAGAHNRSNAQAALLALEVMGFDRAQLLPLLSTFKALPHRLEYIGKKGGVHFYNDSIATIPEATIAALESIKGVNFLIIGGFDRKIHYELLVEYLKNNPINHLLLTGLAGERIGAMLKEANAGMKLHFFDELKDAFEIIKNNRKENDICLLSPAAASYDRYQNFEHRGTIFRNLAEDFDTSPGQ